MGDYKKSQERYNRTRRGVVKRIYSTQKISSRVRNHPVPVYSISELEEWSLLQENFEGLYQNWVKSNFSKKLKPSIDRDDDDKPYTFSNIQWTTWEINNSKSKKKNYKPVVQLDKQGNFESDYVSISEAERVTKISNGNISFVCKNKRKTAGGFIWKYKKDYENFSN